MQKTNISEDIIIAFLNKKFTSYKLIGINSGEVSQAFELSVAGKDLILRLNSTAEGFEKDKIINEQFPKIRSAKILEIGEFNPEVFYCISERLAGESLRYVDWLSDQTLLADLFEQINTIHLTPIAEIADLIDSEENFLTRYLEVNNWQKIKASFPELDVELLEKLAARSEKLYRFIPQQMYFLHGDLGRSNIFASDTKISGFIDWSDTKFGDFLWDIAWLNFWTGTNDFVQKYFQFNQNSASLNLDNFAERIELYTIVMGIHHQLFGAKRNDLETYAKAKEILSELSN